VTDLLIPTRRVWLHSALLLLAAGALILALGCESTTFPGRIQVGLQNTTGDPANMWIGHGTEAPGGSQVPAKNSIFAWVEVKVRADKNREGGYAKSIADCSAGHRCVFADDLLVNVAQGGKTESKKFDLYAEIGDYEPNVYAIWDGRALTLSTSPAR